MTGAIRSVFVPLYADILNCIAGSVPSGGTDYFSMFNIRIHGTLLTSFS